MLSYMLNPLTFRNPKVPGRPRRAVWRHTTLAESPATQCVDGFEYFPPDAVAWDLLEESDHTSVCPWKGVAGYFDVVVDGERLERAAWSYRAPSDAAGHIRGHVAFWRGVRVLEA